MRFPRDLSIGRKLALSAALTVLLLGGLYASARSGMTALVGQQDRIAHALAAQRRVASVQLVGAELRAIARQIPSVQELPALATLLARADTVAARGQAILAASLAAHPDPLAETDLQAAAATLRRFAAILQQAGKLRHTILRDRGRHLIQARPVFETSLASFAVELDHHGHAQNIIPGAAPAALAATPPAAALPATPAQTAAAAAKQQAAKAARARQEAALAAARRRFDRYRQAMSRLQNAALLFLATGNFTVADEIKADRLAARKEMAALRKGDLPEDAKSDAQIIAALGAGIRETARTLIGQTLTLEHFVSGPVAMTERSMIRNLRAATAEFDRQARTAGAESAAAARAAQTRLLAIAATIALMLALSGWLTARAIAGPMRAMTDAVAHMADGDATAGASAAIARTGRRDEIGRMAVALEALRNVVREAFVKAEIIANLPIGLMTAAPDGDFAITYVNPEAVRLLGPVAAHLPVSPDELAGKSIDIFHRAPEHQRALLADPANLPHRTRITLGEERFDLSVTAIRDREGAYVGPMVTWRRATQQMRLVGHFEDTVGAIARELGAKAGAMRETARALAAVAGDAGARTGAVAAASEEASTNVGAVAASAEELSASVAEISRQVAESAAIAGQAVREAEATDHSVAGLSEAAGRIGEVVRLIGDIAGRTNLLALNATIEAARAGEAGKGFAVVASEVKTLATQTARATEEIGGQIAAMQGATGQAVEALRSIAGTIQRMNAIATSIAESVAQQGDATREIARAVQQVAAGTAEVTGNIAHVADAVRRTGGEAETVLGAADALAAEAGRLSTEAESFVGAIQQAA